MTIKMRHSRTMARIKNWPWYATAALVLITLLMFTYVRSLDAATVDAQTRKIMRDVFGAVVYLLPLTMNEGDLFDPARKNITDAQIEKLANAAGALDAHAQAHEETGYQLLSRSFSRRVARLQAYYDHELPVDAHFELLDLTKNCAACHSQLSGTRNFPFADLLLQRIDLDALELDERVRLQIATRRFDDALGTWEWQFLDAQADPTDFDIDSTFVDYLVIALGALGDTERANRTLKTVLARPDVPYYLRRHLDIWITSLHQLKGVLSEQPSLALARSIFEEAQPLSVMPMGRERVVHDIAASRVLQRYVADSADSSNDDLAEAYYMLGVIEGRTADPKLTVPEMEFHFEAAIRLAPEGPFAKLSYALLEEYSMLNYGGFPIDDTAAVVAPLKELRKLIGIPEIKPPKDPLRRNQEMLRTDQPLAVVGQ